MRLYLYVYTIPAQSLPEKYTELLESDGESAYLLNDNYSISSENSSSDVNVSSKKQKKNRVQIQTLKLGIIAGSSGKLNWRDNWKRTKEKNSLLHLENLLNLEY